MGYNLVKELDFELSGEVEGKVEVRYIKEYGVCLCVFYNEDWHFVPLANIKDKASYENTMNELNKVVAKELKGIKSENQAHYNEENPHSTKFKNLRDVSIDSIANDKIIRWDGTRFVPKDLDYKEINTFANITVVAGASGVLDLSALTTNSLMYSITGTGNVTITEISNATLGQQYTIVNNTPNTNKISIKNHATIHTPRGLDMLIEYRSVVTFLAINTSTIVCISYSDNVS